MTVRSTPELAPAPDRIRDAVHHQFGRFVGVGLLSTLLDGIVYHLALLTVVTPVAKAAGYLVGTACSIACNYRWTFGYAGPDGRNVVLRCCLLYATALILNVAANGAAMTVLKSVSPAALVHHATAIAFVFAVGVSTVYNFLGMRLWVFRRQFPIGSGQ
ncbi:GtrA family protein [Sphingomonas sp. MA1305]|uniref:GtrA family protein n=1 Tax=Sphingomonas sp. MA1305 TaxID=2479204 RepID=UPI0018E022E6|nr:GtrA family protein [Sphingomonas sp. MA1305]